MRSSEPIVEKGLGPVSQSQPCTDAGTHIPRSPHIQSLLTQLDQARHQMRQMESAARFSNGAKGGGFLSGQVAETYRFCAVALEAAAEALTSPPQPHVAPEGEGNSVSHSQPCGEASSSEEVFAGLDPAVSAAMDANFWKAEWHKLDAIRDDLLEALQETWRVLRLAGTLNLSRGAQLGQTVWYVKISDAEAISNAALAKAAGNQECVRKRCVWPECACGDHNPGPIR